MMNCPACGAANSVKKEICYRCNARLHALPEAKEEKAAPAVIKVCADCSHACIFPPPGCRLKENEIWCAHLESAFAVDHPAGSCFSEPFKWRREEIMD